MEPQSRDPRRGYEPDSLLALHDLAGRTGAISVEFGWNDNECPVEKVRWWARLTYPEGVSAELTDQETYDAALAGVARRVMHGGMCRGCDRPAVVEGMPGMPHRVRLPDGSHVLHTLESLEESGICQWELKGARWERWCGDQAPAGSTRERLARALVEIRAHSMQVGAARSGRYDENLSPLAMPLVMLLEELLPYGERGQVLSKRVADGEFDTTAEENEAYWRSPKGSAEARELGDMLLSSMLSKVDES